MGVFRTWVLRHDKLRQFKTTKRKRSAKGLEQVADLQQSD